MKLASAHVESCLILDGKKYEIVEFNIAFTQPTDYKGQPQHEMNGGQLYITLPHIADDPLYEWAISSTQLKNGEVFFFSEIVGTVIHIAFFNAYGIYLGYHGGSRGGYLCMKLIIAPERLTVNGIEHNNFWPE